MLNRWFLDRRRWNGLMVSVVILGIAWMAGSRIPGTGIGTQSIPSPRAGFPAPELAVSTLSGEMLRLSEYQGQPVILNFWASWCAPCRAEMPALQRVADTLSTRGLVVLGVNSTQQDSPAAAATFLQELHLGFLVGLDLDGAASRRYLVRALPTTFFIRPDGVIQAVIVGGPMSDATLQSQAETLLAEAP